MRTTVRILSLAVALCAGVFTTTAADSQDHARHKATPKGGRVLDKTEPRAEFVVEKDRTVTINFYDNDLKPVPVTTQGVTVIATAKDKVTLEFERKGDSLVSKTKLPEGEGYPVVVQFRAKPDAKVQNLRFKLDLHTCAECKRPEYGCICDH